MQEPQHEAELAGGDTDEMCELAERAIGTAASDLGLNPLLFARELAQGEIGLLISYLRAAAQHVDDLDLRVRIDRLLHRLTDWTQDAEQERSPLSGSRPAVILRERPRGT